MNQFSLYGGFIGNYEEAVEVVRRCAHTDARFRTLAEVHPLPPPLWCFTLHANANKRS